MNKQDKTTKTYTENGIKYMFSNEALYRSIKHKQDVCSLSDQKKPSQAKIQKELAASLKASPETVKSWVYGNNSPFDLEQVKAVADFFEIDYHDLLVKKEEEENMTAALNYMAMTSEKQRVITRDRVREIYEALAEAINTAWNYFYTEFYGSLGEKADELFLKKYHIQYEEAEWVCQKVDFLLLKYQLDIPESLQTKIRSLKWSLAEGVIQETCSLFIDLMDDEYKKEAEDGIEVLFRKIEGYVAVRQAIDVLNDAFSEYIVNE